VQEERGYDAEANAQLREAERNTKLKQEEEYKHMGYFLLLERFCLSKY
jgi:hypothetical protein